jgi:hypothetical protein
MPGYCGYTSTQQRHSDRSSADNHYWSYGGKKSVGAAKALSSMKLAFCVKIEPRYPTRSL